MAQPKRARHEAAQWLARRYSGEWNAAKQRLVDDWLNENELHRREFQAMERLWERIGSLRFVDLPDLAAARAYRRPRLRWVKSAAWAAGLYLAARLLGLSSKEDPLKGARNRKQHRSLRKLAEISDSPIR